jgi:hypothetical protein
MGSSSSWEAIQVMRSGTADTGDIFNDDFNAVFGCKEDI